MKNYTITVNGNVYDVTVEKRRVQAQLRLLRRLRLRHLRRRRYRQQLRRRQVQAAFR